MRLLLPRFDDVDRGTELEGDWKALDIPFHGLRDLEEQGQVPSMVLSPMMVEDGRRLLISNLDLWALAPTRSRARKAGCS